MDFIIDKRSVCCAVRIEYLSIFRLVFVFNVQMLNECAQTRLLLGVRLAASLGIRPI